MIDDILTPEQIELSVGLAEAPKHAITFSVHGPASTKGSTRSFPHAKTGKIITVADARRLPVWTQAVAWSARAAGVKVVAKPRGVVVAIWLVFARPSSVKTSARPRMTVKPDPDKCLRAALDALTGIAYEDDAQVVRAIVDKRYGPTAETYLQIWEAA